ncbi:MAG TPA: hypothetical protein VN625_08005 [Desulfuromonadaceae bacterium]|nr:hypothetical protein [Desulfuromonadaceae bacterium]
MEAVLEVILQIFFELLLQFIGEVACEFGLQSLSEIFHRKPNPWLAGIGYILLGAGIGGLSLLVARSTFIHHPTLRIANLFLTPLLAGLLMAAIGHWRRKRGQDLIRLDRFGYGFLFAFSMALVRFLYATRPAG